MLVNLEFYLAEDPLAFLISQGSYDHEGVSYHLMDAFHTENNIGSAQFSTIWLFWHLTGSKLKITLI